MKRFLFAILLGALPGFASAQQLTPVERKLTASVDAGTTDAIAGQVDMAIDGLGLKGRDNHTNTETADLKSLGVQAKRVAILLSRLAKRPAAQ